MKLSVTDQKKYPLFTHYVKKDFPKLSRVPKIIKNISKYGNLTLTAFKAALIWGASPMIRITNLHSGQCGVPKAYGCFRHSKPHAIEIHIQVIADFEKSHSTSTDKNKKGRAVYVAGATLLHEICHWGNYNNVPKVPELKEMGAAFELSTYGKIIY
ncbi:hypothetical protein MNBD_GAMMA15-1740 [hydrothermal vent metagenome]|uniref:Tox-MPTase3 domain-containing protein n=1 Tax=hydrothermal vent metagenome TaxID=652676 RepID=A0A3B0Y081_9ZZZZ